MNCSVFALDLMFIQENVDLNRPNGIPLDLNELFRHCVVVFYFHVHPFTTGDSVFLEGNPPLLHHLLFLNMFTSF
jgi:hypothetical protein